MMNKTRLLLTLSCLVFLLPAISAAAPIKWESYKDGMKQAKAEKKKIFVNFHADW